MRGGSPLSKLKTFHAGSEIIAIQFSLVVTNPNVPTLINRLFHVNFLTPLFKIQNYSPTKKASLQFQINNVSSLFGYHMALLAWNGNISICRFNVDPKTLANPVPRCIDTLLDHNKLFSPIPDLKVAHICPCLNQIRSIHTFQ